MNESIRNLFFRDVTYYFEKYLLSSLMLYFALKNLLLLMKDIDMVSFANHLARQENMGGVPEIIIYYPLISHSILFLYNAFDGSILLCSKRPQQAPNSWKAIFIPLVSAYAMLAYNLVGYLPAWATVNYTPPTLLFSVLIASCLFVLCGQLVALVAVLYLRRSFAVLIQLREVVLRGPYLYVRHPIYFGYILLTIGMLLSNVCLSYIFISFIYISLLAYRARMEENLLAEANPAYKINMERTGFLFPRLSALATG